MKNLITRRNLLRFAGLFGAANVIPGSSVAEQAKKAVSPAAAAPPSLDPVSVYKSIGVRPLINGRGTLTVIGGSMELPEVRAAKNAANQAYAQLDEVMDAVGKRLAELTGAEWGMVSAGCAAAMSHATAACVAGGNPDLHVRIPNLAGFAKDEVIIPGTSRNVYDAAIRAVGVKIIEVESPEALRLAIGPRTAMIYLFAGPRLDSGPMSMEAICQIAKQHNVPVMVDAAAEILTIPNVHLQRGATLVGYSGGKFIRGPQSAGLLLGRKDLVQAAWIHSAPHHGYARAMKVGREEMIGMLVAVESWVKRDHKAEWAKWVARCDYIAESVTKIPGITAEVVREPGASLSNRSPRVSLRWDSKQFGLTGADAANLLEEGEPRIALGGGGGGWRSRRRPANGWRLQYLDVSGHAGRRRRENRGAAHHRSVVGEAHAQAGRSASHPGCQPVGPLGSRDQIHGEQHDAHTGPSAERQSTRGHSPGQLHHTGRGGYHQRRHRFPREQRHRAPWRFVELPVQRQGIRRHDLGRAEHGRVPECDLDGEASGAGGESRDRLIAGRRPGKGDSLLFVVNPRKRGPSPFPCPMPVENVCALHG